MTQKRLLAVFTALLTLMTLVVGRLYLIACNRRYAQTAEDQTITTLELGSGRGNFYDTRGLPLTGSSCQLYALSIPGESSYDRLFQFADPAGQAMLYQKRNSSRPFLVPVRQDLTGQGIFTCSVPRRWLPSPIAPHLLGYLDGEGSGAAGLEAACDALLSESGPRQELRCVTTAQGQLLRGQPPLVTGEPGTGQGVRLTLDRRIQRLCEGTAEAAMTRGCILVLDTATAGVRACVSLPAFDPNDLQKSIRADDTSLLNRALYPFNVGSVFKPVLAAAALERGWDWYSVDCEGYVDLNHHIYRCARSRAHGRMNLRGALEKSCNCFFIELALDLGAGPVWQMARNFGFGSSQAVAGELRSRPGTLPDERELEDLGQLASIGFGQGRLTATPLQIAAMMNTIACGGVYTEPGFVEGAVREADGVLVRRLTEPRSRRILRPDTAAALQKMLISVVEEGIGREARPSEGGAGGKTGTAQTGQYNEEGEEKMNFWFAGFWPAERPRYTIVVLQDGQTAPAVSSAAVFAQLCTGLSYLED